MHVRGGMETSEVGCAIPVWRSSMPCSGVPPFVPVRFVCGTRSSILDGLSCTKGVWYIYDWDTGSSILIW